MKITDVKVKHPDAYREWVALCQTHDSDVAVSHFTVMDDGAIIGDGAQEFTKFVWYPGVSTEWVDLDEV